MRRNSKHHNNDIDERQPFLPDELTESPVAVASELRERLSTVENQVLSQFTSSATYATIAQRHSATVQAEARADVERVKAQCIGLIDTLRAETNRRLTAIELRVGFSADNALGPEAEQRVSTLEQRLSAMNDTLEQMVRENQVLRSRLNDVLRHQMTEEGWLVSNGPASELSLH